MKTFPSTSIPLRDPKDDKEDPSATESREGRRAAHPTTQQVDISRQMWSEVADLITSANNTNLIKKTLAES